MTKRVILAISLLLAAAITITAQTRADSINAMSLNGSTGHITVPNARIAWQNSDFGMDFGYGFVWIGEENIDHQFRYSLSVLQKFEVHGLLQIGKIPPSESGLQNFVLGGKYQIVEDNKSAIALGTDIEVAHEVFPGPSAKIYLASTYEGKFFTLPAIVTATFGWQFVEGGDFSSQFLYGMGFSLGLFPDTFKNHVYWISDFSNFSYVVHAANVNAFNRGAFNTGLRIHPLKRSNFKLVIDIIGSDLLDDKERGLAVTLSGGISLQ